MAHIVSVDCICSGMSNTDQLSVKDSGKGDSDFNDSDSDISGDGVKKNFRTFQPRLKSEFSRLCFEIVTKQTFNLKHLNNHLCKICIYCTIF